MGLSSVSMSQCLKCLNVSNVSSVGRNHGQCVLGPNQEAWVEFHQFSGGTTSIRLQINIVTCPLLEFNGKTYYRSVIL